MLKAHVTQAVGVELADEVEALLNPAEPDGTFRNTVECAAGLLALGLLLLSPPTPQPKKG